MPNIGPMEIAIVLIIALVVFGPKKLPELGRGLGTGLREFKQSVTDAGQEMNTPLLDSAAADAPVAEVVSTSASDKSTETAG